MAAEVGIICEWICDLNEFAASMIGALQDRLSDSDSRVQRGARAALDWINFATTKPDKRKVRNARFEPLLGRKLPL